MTEYWRNVVTDDSERLLSSDALARIESDLFSLFRRWNDGGGDAVHVDFVRTVRRHLAPIRQLFLDTEYGVVPLVSVVDLPDTIAVSRNGGFNFDVLHWNDMAPMQYFAHPDWYVLSHISFICAHL